MKIKLSNYLEYMISEILGYSDYSSGNFESGGSWASIVEKQLESIDMNLEIEVNKEFEVIK